MPYYYSIEVTIIMSALLLGWALLRRRNDIKNTNFSNILDHASNEAYLFNADTLQIVDSNLSAQTRLGYESSELQRLNYSDLLPALSEEDIKHLIRQIGNDEKKEQVCESICQRKDGSAYPVEIRLKFARNKNSRLMMGIIQDITGRLKKRMLRHHALQLEPFKDEIEAAVKSRTEELKKSNKELKEKNRLKTDYVAIVSHELRTPLTSIKSLTEILHDDFHELDDESKIHFLSIVNNETDRLSRLINDVLDLQRLDVNRMIWRDKEVDLKLLVKESMESFSVPIANKGLSLTAQLPDEDNPFLMTIDADKFTQILANLISNAMKFTKNGGITVTLQRIYRQQPALLLCTYDDCCPSLIEILKKKGINVTSCLSSFDDTNISDDLALIVVDGNLPPENITAMLSSPKLINIPIITCISKGSNNKNVSWGEADNVVAIPDNLDLTKLINLIDQVMMPHTNKSNDYHYQLIVSDTGHGIPASELDKIFGRFHQVKNEPTSSVGSGLGLSICQEYIEHYEGSIRVSSELGKGSSFTVTLPPVKPPQKKLGDILVKKGIATEEQIEEALEMQNKLRTTNHHGMLDFDI